jgi:hypothetical protein
MVLPRPTAATGHAAKLEFSSNDRSKNKVAGQFGALYVDRLHVVPTALLAVAGLPAHYLY